MESGGQGSGGQGTEDGGDFPASSVPVTHASPALPGMTVAAQKRKAAEKADRERQEMREARIHAFEIAITCAKDDMEDITKRKRRVDDDIQEADDALETAIENAQKIAEAAIKTATEKANRIAETAIKTATEKANRIAKTAKENAKKKAETKKKRLEDEKTKVIADEKEKKKNIEEFNAKLLNVKEEDDERPAAPSSTN